MKHLSNTAIARILVITGATLSWSRSVLHYLDSHELPVQDLGFCMLQLAALLFVFTITKKN